MTTRRRRALAYAVGSFVVAVVCAVLSSNVDGFQRGLLLALAVAWLVIGGLCVGSALRSAPAADPEIPADDAP
jgi:hypothetical protein